MTDQSGLDMPENVACAFCDYLSGRRPFTIAAHTDRIAVLVTREQRGVPHLLVIPVAHRPSILDLSDNEISALAIGVRAAAQAISDAYRRPGIAVWQNNGVPAHQSIAHVHFHVAGTLPDGGTEWGEVAEEPLEQTDAIAAVIAPYLHLDDQSAVSPQQPQPPPYPPNGTNHHDQP
ncbi:HIT family protein [Mycobacteroides abscessus]|uniref:HIT family protein n=1 Tax=Mycobacteroides abscessus TaxID=36809 RepID=UPI000928185D|nr:HIT family protein [Mycobacteroides abscessus]SHQ43743.1 HIT family hydrolase, diadenosine tetraphosphate hydrolase [Mycobacteroides abscessus subsp. abscessus]SHR10932.1 HIT family hydrolase, diadenosine tetraphosphate hydrolase [Mycobacteroides abscessus subsp. abscessus]SHR37198.1 HIT family hydrolase, diadenosine tetraphosphate hydrolase [Mycobacteroides abscessus subsp. abscessus]SHS77957.1 HIT family hydrolase, diadenosine tetraphosphate hydrolase [Mycobacteroides abscessus subsp. absc